MVTTAARYHRPNARRLRIFSFDPALAARYDLVGTSHVTIEVPWEDDLRPGPVGEYVEVVDVDPAAGAAYAPIDLNAPELLATDGLQPSRVRSALSPANGLRGRDEDHRAIRARSRQEGAVVGTPLSAHTGQLRREPRAALAHLSARHAAAERVL